MNNFFYTSKTANVILVYKYSRIKENKHTRRVVSRINPLARWLIALKGFALSLGRLRLERQFLSERSILSTCEVAK